MRIKYLRRVSEIRLRKTRLLHLGDVEKPPHPQFLPNGRLRVKFWSRLRNFMAKRQIHLPFFSVQVLIRFRFPSVQSGSQGPQLDQSEKTSTHSIE